MKTRTLFGITLLVFISVSLFGILTITQFVDAQSNSIPSWIKNTALWWSEDQVTDNDFINAMEFLIIEGVIQVPGVVNPPDVDSITIGFIPVEKADVLTSNAEDFEQFLESKLNGVDIEIVITTNYETIIEGMRFGHIDAAFMDTGPAWITHSRTGAEAVLAEVVEGKVNYQATVWASADNDSIQSLEDTL